MQYDNQKFFNKNTEYFFWSSTKAESTSILSVFTRTFRGTETSAQENLKQFPSHYDSRTVNQKQTQIKNNTFEKNIHWEKWKWIKFKKWSFINYKLWTHNVTKYEQVKSEDWPGTSCRANNSLTVVTFFRDKTFFRCKCKGSLWRMRYFSASPTSGTPYSNQTSFTVQNLLMPRNTVRFLRNYDGNSIHWPDQKGYHRQWYKPILVASAKAKDFMRLLV